jgi:hypothetical protein
VSFQNLILKNYEARKNEFYMKASWYGTKAKWLYHGPTRVKWKWNAYYISTWTKVTQVSDVAPWAYCFYWLTRTLSQQLHSYNTMLRDSLLQCKNSLLNLVRRTPGLAKFLPKYIHFCISWEVYGDLGWTLIMCNYMTIYNFYLLIVF